MECEYPTKFPSIVTIDADTYDDRPLFTRSASHKSLGQDSARSFPNSDKCKDSENSKGKRARPDRDSIWVLNLPRWSTTILSPALRYFEASMFATILEDVLMQLQLLDMCNNEMQIFKVKTDMEALVCAKYSIEAPKVKDEMHGIDVTQLHSEHYKLCKIISDRQSCNEVMMDTYLRLALKSRFCPLVKHRKTVTNRQEHYLQLIEDESRNKIARRSLMRNLRHHRNQIKSTIYDTDATLNGLVSQIEDFSLQTEVRNRYINGWQGARSEQNNWRIHNKEKGPSDSIAFYRKKFEDEQRVHTEVEALTNIQYNETLVLVENMMAKYDKDIEDIDLKIQRMRKRFEEETDKRLEMEEKFAEHDKEMKAWVQFKDERERARVYRETMTNAAIAVQAWWRGILVRLALGPYKPTKRPPPKEKKKK